MRRKLMLLMAAEILSGNPMDTFSNHAMARGHEIEPVALEYYAFAESVSPKVVGFVRRTIFREFSGPLIIGCSPDALVGDNGGVEIKRMQADLVVDLAESGRIPSEHKAQVQGNMFVTGRAWWDLLIYPDPYIPFVPKFRIYRDDDYHATLKDEIDRFDYELRAMVDRVRKKGG